MLFPDYTETGFVYHVAPVTDLDLILKKGIKYDDKDTYRTKYLKFHRFIDSFKPQNIPDWVIREKAIFGSLNFSDDHMWHSHSVLMAIEVEPKKCWIANENLANSVYEAFILKDIDGFSCAKKYINIKGKEILKEYWDSSLSFLDNLKLRRDKQLGYDAEVLIYHDIPPNKIKLISMISDHKMMSIKEWEKFFLCGGG